MPVTQNGSAPYAPAKAILGIIDRYRNKGMPAAIDSETLARSGIADSLIPRTLQALVALDLIDNDYKPTETLEGLRLAPENEFQDRLAEWLRGAYADALNFVDADASQTEIRDAFRSYNPVGQQPRMVALFTGLLTAAGLRDKPEKQAASSGSPAPRKARYSTERRSSTGRTPPPRIPRHDDNLNPAITGFLHNLPTGDDGWTKEKRDQFMTAFGTVLDFCIPIVENGNIGNNKADMENEDEI